MSLRMYRVQCKAKDSGSPFRVARHWEISFELAELRGFAGTFSPVQLFAQY